MREGATDSEKAIELGRGEAVDVSRFKQQYQMQLNYLGDPKRRLQILMELSRELANQGRRHSVYRQIAETYVQLGDLKQTETYVRLNQARFAESRGFGGFPHSGNGWEANVLQGNARLHEVRGQYREAEAVFRRARAAYQADWAKWSPDRDGGSSRSGIELQIDAMQAFEGRAKARQGRLAEGEADVRRALLGRLKAVGKYHLWTAQMIGLLANVLAEQGRNAEAEQLIRTQLEIFQVLGIDRDSQSMAMAWSRLATIQNLAGNWSAAAESYRRLDEVTRNWEPARREELTLSINQIATLYGTDNLAAGIAAAERLLQRQKGVYGEQNIETALARGMLAVGLAKARRDDEALREFKLAISVLLTTSRETDSEDTLTAAAREQRAQIVIEAYMALLARIAGPTQERAAAETFRLAEAIRGRSVQKAVSASTARMVASNPALADSARNERISKSRSPPSSRY
jgi:tetratricopeptide (TPR) repeat protein